ncbi:sugar ABC transporter substrate-binding protein [Schumannella soli]|uniref:Sugar ABC transporter substrate-binding protein n=1 Tax=Schumannella soli TaxID=2590779 RepID=A0A506XX81_9MICO|nr:sugar ABC transporter substrate-binding protein [Schumannella soli]TPW74826.1 sugar ABC transporter substrate-binding protein [Schumannella soli]
MKRRTLAAIALATALVGLVAGCSSGTSAATGKKVTVDAGGTSVSVQGPIRLAYFAPSVNNAWLQSSTSTVKAEVAKIKDAKVTVFDAKWDGTTQFNQVQNALQSNRFNAMIIDPINDEIMCKIMSQTAPKKGVVVSVIAVPLCGRALKVGEEQYTPGTLNYIGGTDSSTVFEGYIEHMAKENPGPQKVIALSGPKLFGVTKNLEKAIETMKKKYPDFDIVSTVDTDYTLNQGQAKLAPLLKANPDTTVVFSAANSDVTQGAYQALKGAGLDGKVKLYDKGASKWAIEQLRDGTLAGSSPYYPSTMAAQSVKAIAAAFAGEKVTSYLPNDGAELTGEAAKTGVQILTPADAKSFDPEY